jgi:hypothetical protein
VEDVATPVTEALIPAKPVFLVHRRYDKNSESTQRQEISKTLQGDKGAMVGVC